MPPLTPPQSHVIIAEAKSYRNKEYKVSANIDIEDLHILFLSSHSCYNNPYKE